MAERKSAVAKEDKPKAPRKRATKNLAAAKEKVASGKAAAPAKRAEHLTRVFPELQDSTWVKGNPDAVKKLRGE